MPPRATPRRVLLAAPALLLLPMALPAALHADTPLEALMRRFAAVRESRARFTEDKVIPELALPLPSRGTLLYRAPGYVEKHTTDPVEEILTVDGDRLVIDRPAEHGHTEINLDQSPEIRPLVEAIRSTLAGDLPTLRRYLDVGYAGFPDDAWSLTLTPLSIRVRGVVQRLTLSGTGTDMRSMETEAQGGTTRMWIEPAR